MEVFGDDQKTMIDQGIKIASWGNNVLLDGPTLKKKLERLLQEKEINDQITNKIKLENENLKNQLSKNQIDLILL